MYLALWVKKSYHFYVLREVWSWTDIIVCLSLSSQTSALTNLMSLRALLGHKKPIRFIDSYLTSDSLFCFVQHSYFCNKYEWSSSSFLDLYFLFLMYSFSRIYNFSVQKWAKNFYNLYLHKRYVVTSYHCCPTSVEFVGILVAWQHCSVISFSFKSIIQYKNII